MWINRYSLLPEQKYVQMNTVITPEMLGIPGAGTGEMRISSVAILKLSGFNDTVNIVLPQEARNAQALPLSFSNSQMGTFNSSHQMMMMMTRLNTSQMLASNSSLMPSLNDTQLPLPNSNGTSQPILVVQEVSSGDSGYGRGCSSLSNEDQQRI